MHTRTHAYACAPWQPAHPLVCSIPRSLCQVDAEKSLRLRSLPPVLTLHLKRFIFDYGLGRRVKLFDPVAFPAVLDMGPFLHVEGGPDCKPEGQGPAGPDPLLYDLYAVLVHYGSAMGGHYFAYIKVGAMLPESPSLNRAHPPSSLPQSRCRVPAPT